MIARPMVVALLLLVTGALAACAGQPLSPADGPGVDFTDPEAGGGVGSLNGSIPAATREPSPRLDATAQALATFPTDLSLPVATTPTVALPSPTLLPTPMPDATTTPTPELSDPTPTESPTAEPIPSETPTEIIHIVESGENLYRIGLQYGVSWESIAEYNGIANPDQIEVGQELRIPPTPTPTPSSEEGP